MKKQTLVSLAVASGLTAVAVGAHAADNPFAVKPLAAGYQLAQADKKADGKCGEAKCGADQQAAEKKAAEKKAADKKKDGKCGEAKCGADKKDGK